MVVLNLSNTMLSADKVSYIIRRKPFDREGRNYRNGKHKESAPLPDRKGHPEMGDYVYTGTIYTANAAHKECMKPL